MKNWRPLSGSRHFYEKLKPFILFSGQVFARLKHVLSLRKCCEGFHIAGDPEPDRFCHPLLRQLKRVERSLWICLALRMLEESESEADITLTSTSFLSLIGFRQPMTSFRVHYLVSPQSRFTPLSRCFPIGVSLPLIMKRRQR